MIKCHITGDVGHDKSDSAQQGSSMDDNHSCSNNTPQRKENQQQEQIRVPTSWNNNIWLYLWSAFPVEPKPHVAPKQSIIESEGRSCARAPPALNHNAVVDAGFRNHLE